MIVLWFGMFAGCSTPAPPGEVAAVATRKIDTSALRAALDVGQVPVLVDVRTPGEYTSGHVAGARNVPINELDKRLTELELYRGGEIFVICEVGGRSARAASLLSAEGFHPVDVTDGMSGWRKRGFPIE